MLLKDAAAYGGEGPLSVVVWGISRQMDNLSAAVLWALAVGTVVAGSLLSSQDLLEAKKLGCRVGH
jgi:hypothetical protein